MRSELLTFLQSVNYPLHEKKAYGHGWTVEEASRRMFYVSKVVTNENVIKIAHGYFNYQIEGSPSDQSWRERYDVFRKALGSKGVRFLPEKYNSGWELYIYDKETFLFGIGFHPEHPYSRWKYGRNYDGRWFDWVDEFCQNQHRICDFHIVCENIQMKRAVRCIENAFLQWLYRPSGQTTGMGKYTEIAQENFEILQKKFVAL